MWRFFSVCLKELVEHVKLDEKDQISGRLVEYISIPRSNVLGNRKYVGEEFFGFRNPMGIQNGYRYLDFFSREDGLSFQAAIQKQVRLGYSRMLQIEIRFSA